MKRIQDRMAVGQAQKLLDAVERVVRSGEHVLAAVSGGADSVALLHLLIALREQNIIQLSAAHFEHGIRGEDSLQDMRFVQRLCAQYHVPIITDMGDVPSEAHRLRKGMEETARDMRRAFLERARTEMGADVIALAHHADDQAETVLMRLLRGSGGRGAGGMRERDGVWIRPLLHCRKRDLINYLSQAGLEWREDATNAQDITPRNSLRLRVMPELEAIWPGAVEALNRFAGIQRMESDFLDDLAQKWLGENAIIGPEGMRIDLVHVPDAVVLARALKIAAGASAQSTDIERLCTLCLSDRGKLVFRGDVYKRAEKAGKTIWLQKELPEQMKIPVRMPGETKFGNLGKLIAQPGEGQPVRNDLYCQELDEFSCEGAILRLWQQGDRIRPLGMHGKTRLLSDLYADKGIASPKRRYMPVLEGRGEILWAIGACISEKAKLEEKSRPIRLRWEPASERLWGDTIE